MFAGVAVFGVATVVFGLSTNIVVSVIALILLGAGDMVSVYLRHLLVQLETPDEIRGRVSAVNAVFIGASNELGEFESGITAAWFGTVRAVVLGGVATVPWPPPGRGGFRSCIAWIAFPNASDEWLHRRAVMDLAARRAVASMDA